MLVLESHMQGLKERLEFNVGIIYYVYLVSVTKLGLLLCGCDVLCWSSMMCIDKGVVSIFELKNLFFRLYFRVLRTSPMV